MTPVLRCALPLLMVSLVAAGGSAKNVKATAAEVRANAVAPSLGAAGSFAVVGSSTVTNTGATIVTGDLGLSPGTSVTGFPPGTVTGTIHAADATALAAQNAVTTAYNALAGQACDSVLTGQNLGGMTLTPGVYCFGNSAQLTGTLTLNGQGNPGAVWVFQIGSTLTTAAGSSVVFTNSGQACGAFWQVGSSATLGTTTSFAGNILAQISITLNNGASSSGGLFAQTGAVTLNSNNVSTVGSCGAVPALPQVAVWALLAALLAVGFFILSRH